ncbi:uncharacterized protein OCT59_019985 [Rhizophagus irregularis]|uniref:uncharacterized protein n=1 Tax=Rhizophagus irregularis TaxID=588596 RepID=UPI0033215249|nr:hypothetical protein OCT59_019985 [Rhizophagus irregularis]
MSIVLSNLLLDGYTKILKTVFEILINYIYSGKLELANNDVKTNIALLIAADELCLNELCPYIENYLLNDKESLKSNFVLILQTVNKFEQFKKLAQLCKEAYQKDPSLVLRADDFVTIEQEYLLEFLTENNDSLRQIEVWDKLIQWAIANSNNELPSDIRNWTNNNVTTFDLAGPQIVDSQIINLRDASFICNWIKVMKKQRLEISYDFNLLVRGNKNNLENSIFSKVIDTKHAIYNYIGFGPCFGLDDSDFVLFYDEYKGQCVINSYEKAIRQSDGYFEVDDYEVFQVIYK